MNSKLHTVRTVVGLLIMLVAGLVTLFILGILCYGIISYGSLPYPDELLAVMIVLSLSALLINLGWVIYPHRSI